MYDRDFANQILCDWTSHPISILRPERWGRGEPVRQSIADTPFDQLVDEWCKVALMFTRVSKPRMTVSLNWRRNKGLDPRPFPWGFVGWLAKSAGPEVARAWFKFCVLQFEPAFANLTTQDESRRKHFRRLPYYVDGRLVGTVERFEGHHVLDTLPGVYWITYFGPPALERIGRERFENLPVGQTFGLGEGIMVIAHGEAVPIGSVQALIAEQTIIDHLGRHHFFEQLPLEALH